MLISIKECVDVSASCLFCKIAQKQIPASIVYEDDEVIAFHDISPQAPVHVLVVPKNHCDNISDIPSDTPDPILAILRAIQIIAKDLGLLKSGFRVVTNTGLDGGQSVNHVHFHILGGRSLKWPPG